VLKIGVISDTHGLLRPEALDALRGSNRIVHAGDVGGPEILDQLREIAPVTAVRGNVDHGLWVRALPKTEVLEADRTAIYVIHILSELDIKPESAGFAAVIYGHSHIPKLETKNGVIFLNPGSAGPRRFNLPVTVGRLTIESGKVCGVIFPLPIPKR